MEKWVATSLINQYNKYHWRLMNKLYRMFKESTNPWRNAK
jgi:hypothetical protein